MNRPPDHIELTLEEALDLLAALEDVRLFLTRLIRHVPLRVEDAVTPLLVSSTKWGSSALGLVWLKG